MAINLDTWIGLGATAIVVILLGLLFAFIFYRLRLRKIKKKCKEVDLNGKKGRQEERSEARRYTGAEKPNIPITESTPRLSESRIDVRHESLQIPPATNLKRNGRKPRKSSKSVKLHKPTDL